MLFNGQKCNLNSTSQWAWVNDDIKEINVRDYIKKKGDDLRCKNGHELILCQGTKIKKYFRHKNCDDCGGGHMTEWHIRMQSYFANTEVILKKLEYQIRERRADALIKNYNTIIEFEHSGKSREDVDCKTRDCKLHGMEIIWFIDGNTDDVIVEELTTGSFLITFCEDWKFKSFTHNYSFVLLEKDDRVFKIPVNKVLNKMILVKEYIPIDDVMNKLNKNPTTIWDEWKDDNRVNAMLTVYQKGAGNGKTYGIWKSISKNRDKEVFIIVTKQHSAKSVILKELNDQVERNEYHIVDNLDEKQEQEYARKYIVKYKHKHSERECIVIIGTIDSFIFNLVDRDHNNSNSNVFEGLLETIIASGVTKVNRETGSFLYAGKRVNLDKKTELWIDEAQDLQINYFNAIIKLIYQTQIDVVIVGDKLQSLEFKENFITCIEEDETNINFIREPPTNENRRIDVEKMSDEINKLINFDKYNLPNIKSVNKHLLSIDEPVEIIDAPCIYASDTSDTNMKKIDEYIEHILEKVEYEVNTHKYSAKDFLFVFPIMKANILANELESRLNKYWIDKTSDPGEEYIQYAILHRHEEGQVIDMNSSINASRLVTIRTSKGDGRNVVFVIGCTEQSLKLLSKGENDLIYESYLHVALTRAKKKVYFGLVKNNDDIHRRFASNGLAEYKPIIKNKLSCNHILTNIDSAKFINILKKAGIREPEKKEEKINTNESIDWIYFCIRRAIYLQFALFYIIKYCKTNYEKSQLRTILEKLSSLPVFDRSPQKFYEYLKSLCKNNDKRDLDFFPLCDISLKPAYKRNLQIVKNHIENNQKKYKNDALSYMKNLKPVEAVVQCYCIELFQRKLYTQTTPMTIYNIINEFENDEETKITALIKESAIIKEIMKKAMMEITSQDNVEWNIENTIKYNGQCDDFAIWLRDILVIGWSDKTVYHFVFQSDFGQLNFWDTIIKIMVERFIIYNTADKGKDMAKFKEKSIKTFLFILKNNDYELFDWNWESHDQYNNEIKELFKGAIVKYFSDYNSQLFDYCMFVKKNPKSWQDKHDDPYDYLAKEYKKESPHIHDFFKELHTKVKNNDQRIQVKEITDSRNLFCDALTQHTEKAVENFFDIMGKKPCYSNDHW